MLTKGVNKMKELSVAISVVGLLGSISSIIFAFLAFKRNEKKEDKKEGENVGQLQSDIKYIVKTLLKLEEEFTKLDDRDRQMLERLSKVEQSLNMIQR